VTKTIIILFITFVGLGYIIYDLKKTVTTLENETDLLQQKNNQLKEKVHTCNLNISSICHAGADYQGDIRYIDCGESFAERWATCLCTTMCLEDFTITVNNRERCRIWPSVPIQIRPEPDEEEDEEEENEK